MSPHDRILENWALKEPTKKEEYRYWYKMLVEELFKEFYNRYEIIYKIGKGDLSIIYMGHFYVTLLNCSYHPIGSVGFPEPRREFLNDLQTYEIISEVVGHWFKVQLSPFEPMYV